VTDRAGGRSIRGRALRAAGGPAIVLLWAVTAVSCAWWSDRRLFEDEPASAPPTSPTVEARRIRSEAPPPLPVPVAEVQAVPTDAASSAPAPTGLPSSPTDALADPAQAAALTSEAIAGFLYQIILGIEEHNPELLQADKAMEQIENEMRDIRFSEGWEFDIRSRRTEIDATRRDTRAGWTRRLDVDPDTGQPQFRNPYSLFGDLDERESELLVRLQRSFVGPDHERYVGMAVKRLEKIEAAIKKQELRREIHVKTLQSLFGLFHARALLPLIDEQIALLQRQIEILRLYERQAEALPRDILDAQTRLGLAREQRLINADLVRAGLRRLRIQTGDPALALPTTFPLVADPAPPPESVDEDTATSYALGGRLDYHLAGMRVRLADRLVRYGAWYLPEVQFEVFWSRFHGHQKWLDEYRRDEGKGFGTQLGLTIPLNLPVRGYMRRRAFEAARDAYVLERRAIQEEVRLAVPTALNAWRQAWVRRAVAQLAINQALEDLRETDLLVQTLPEQIKGVPPAERIEKELAVLDARADRLEAEYLLLLAAAQWDYLAGDSPIEEAIAPYQARDLRAIERKSWIRWLTNLTK